MKIFFVILSVFYCLSMNVGSAVAQFGPIGTPTNPVNTITIETMMVKYYEKPNGINVPGVLKVYASEVKNRDAYPPIIGFMAGLFVKYPNKIDSFLPSQPSQFEKNVITSAFRLAGLTERLKKLEASSGAPGQDAVARTVTSRLTQIRPANGDGLDILWRQAKHATCNPSLIHSQRQPTRLNRRRLTFWLWAGL
jgi:hypothetical protein